MPNLVQNRSAASADGNRAAKRYASAETQRHELALGDVHSKEPNGLQPLRCDNT